MHRHLGHLKRNWTKNWPLSQLSNLVSPGTLISASDCYSFKGSLSHHGKDAALGMGSCLPKLLLLAPNSISPLQTRWKFELTGASWLGWHVPWYLTESGPPLGRALFRKCLMLATLGMKTLFFLFFFFWFKMVCLLVNSQYGWDSTFVLLGTKIMED